MKQSHQQPLAVNISLPDSAIMIAFPQAGRVHAVGRLAERIARAKSREKGEAILAAAIRKQRAAGELTYLAGRPGMCKSGLAVHVALSAASAGYQVRYWSGEMTHEALVQRALTAIAYNISGKRIAYSDLRSGRNITDLDYELLR